MAFNPFHAFRKHQKVIFAILTIICMIVFILQFGRGDIFERLLGRGNQGKGDKVVTLYGRDLYSGDLEHIRQSRQLANDLIVAALNAGGAEATKEVQDYKPEKPDPADMELTALREAWSQRSFQLQIFQFQAANMSPEQAAQERDRLLSEQLPQVRQAYARLQSFGPLSGHDLTTDQAKIAADLRLLLKTQFYSLSRGQQFYCGGGVNPSDLLDFEIWKRQADKLGVVLTRGDARKALADEAAGKLPAATADSSWSSDPAFKDFIAARADQMRAMQITDANLVTAVADEFRVLIAKDLLDGPKLGVAALDEPNRASPDPAAPYDFWKFYRDNRTTLKVAFLPIAVASFLPRVDEDMKRQGPSEQELRDLYEKYRANVPNPESPEPGFKEPHRMKLDYVVARPDTPYYKARILAATLDPEVFYATAVLGAHLAGGGVVPQAALAGVVREDAVQQDYEQFLETNSNWLRAPGFGADRNHEQSYLRPENAAVAVGNLLGVGTGNGPAFSAPAGYVGAADAQEAKDRARLVSAAFLAAVDWSAGGATFGAAGLPVAYVPAPPPRGVTLTQLADKRRKDVTSPVVQADITAFGKELDKVKGKPEEAQTLIAKAVKERGWVYQDKAGLDDVYQVNTDEALRTFRDALLPLLTDPRDPRKRVEFGDYLFKFMKPGVYQLEGPIPEGVDGKLAFWRSEDKSAHELSYDQARERVLAAWKFQTARRLALNAANAAESAAQSQASPLEAVKSLRDQKLGEVFELPEPGRPGIARLVPAPTVDPGLSSVYYRYTIPPDRIPFAPDGLLDRLMTLDRPGKTLIFLDKPAGHFYVAVLEERPNLEFTDRNKDRGFIDAYTDATLPRKDQLWRQFFLDGRQQEFQKNLMRQLREEAGQVNDKGELILSGKQAQQQDTAPPIPSEEDGGEGGF